jgi:O-antigen/teichoic acid export membrane protein
MLKKIFDITSLKANIVANFVGNSWSSLLNIIFVPLYLKYVGAEAYGLIGIFASLQVVLFLLDSGLSTTLNREIAKLSVLPDTQQKMRNLVKTLGTVYWLMSLVAGVIALGLSPLLAKYWVHAKELSVSTVTNAFLLLSLSLIFQFPIGFYTGGLLGLQRQIALNVMNITFSTLKSIGAIVILIFVSQSVIVFFEWTVLVNILQAFTLRFFLWYYLPKSQSKAIFVKQDLKNISRFAAGLVGISLTAILLTQIDKIILSKILSLEQFGYYTIACTLGLTLTQIVGPITQSYFPKFTSLIGQNNIQDLKTIYHQGCRLMSNFVLPAMLMLAFFSKELIFIWTQSQVTTQNTWIITAIYGCGTGINALINIPFILTISYGWTKLGFYQNILFLVLMIPLTIFLAIKFGAAGGAFSWVTINILAFFVTPHLIHNRILKGEVSAWYWNDIIIPAFISIFIIVCFKFFIYNPQPTDSRWTSLLYLVFVGLLTIAVSLFFTKDIYLSMKNKLLGTCIRNL